MSGSLVESVGFKAMIVGMGVICFLYAPLLFWLKGIVLEFHENCSIRVRLLVHEGLADMAKGSLTSFAIFQHQNF